MKTYRVAASCFEPDLTQSLDERRRDLRAHLEALLAEQKPDLAVVPEMALIPDWDKQPGSGAELCKHLARHGVDVTFDQVHAKGRSIGDVLEAHVTERNIDLLVMGGYAHSKLREFILGGATRSVLSRPFTWTLLSH